MFGSQAAAVRVKDVELVQPPPDSVSKISFSPTSDILAVACWDNNVRLYNVNSSGQSEPKAMYSHQGPVLDLCWSTNGQFLFSGGCDNAVQMYDVNSGQNSQVAAHDAPVKCVRYSEMPNGQGGTGVLITAGWDKKVKYWDMRSPNPIVTVDLSDKAYAMDCAEKLLVIGTADRKNNIIDLNTPQSIWKVVDSPLKWQTRTIACFPNGEAYAIASVEGRVAIQYAGPGDEKRNYSFKCHRYDIPAGSMPGTPASNSTLASATSQHVFAVNDICFHKGEGTFGTGGADGSITFWDGVARTKLKPFTLKDLDNGDTEVRPPQFGTPVVSMSFNHNQQILAYALSYDWSKGHGGAAPAGQPTNTRIMLHPVKLEEVQKKKKP